MYTNQVWLAQMSMAGWLGVPCPSKDRPEFGAGLAQNGPGAPLSIRAATSVVCLPACRKMGASRNHGTPTHRVPPYGRSSGHGFLRDEPRAVA